MAVDQSVREQFPVGAFVYILLKTEPALVGRSGQVVGYDGDSLLVYQRGSVWPLETDQVSLIVPGPVVEMNADGTVDVTIVRGLMLGPNNRYSGPEKTFRNIKIQEAS